MRASLRLALGGLAVAARAAGAQDACDAVKELFDRPPRIGDWAELRMETKKDGRPVVTRVGFVGREERDGRQMYRMQVVSTLSDGKRYVMQALTPWDAAALAGDYDREVVVKAGDQPAMVMPIKAQKNQPWAYDLRKECAKIKLVGEETIAVPAGRFRTRHYAGPDGDSWVSPEVPGWRVVKMVTKRGDTMVLTAVGTGAKNEITEKPVDMKALMADPEAARRMSEEMRKGRASER